MGTPKLILIQLEQDTVVLVIPKVIRLLGPLGQLPGGWLWHWLGSGTRWCVHERGTPSLEVQELGKPRRGVPQLPVQRLGACTVALSHRLSSVGLK